MGSLDTSFTLVAAGAVAFALGNFMTNGCSGATGAFGQALSSQMRQRCTMGGLATNGGIALVVIGAAGYAHDYVKSQE